MKAFDEIAHHNDRRSWHALCLLAQDRHLVGLDTDQADESRGGVGFRAHIQPPDDLHRG